MKQTDIQTWIALDRMAPEPLYRQVYRSIQQLILAGRLPPGAKIPSIRALSKSLDVSRNTIVNALAQLSAEGYLEARVGAGTFVGRTLPESHLQIGASALEASPPRPHSGTLSRRGRAVGQLLSEPVDRPAFVSPVGAFSIDGPDLNDFPWGTWRRISGRVARRAPLRLQGYQRDLGFRPLRDALCEHLALARGVRCSADQILIVSGSQEALFLTANILLDPGDEAWIEDPGYPGMRRALAAAGAGIVPVRVDEAGMDVGWALAHHSRSRLACVTPSHQFPLGPMLSLTRRLALLEWVDANSSWILEDDYDSEFRYVGRPLQALQGLDGGQRVVYAGTFSKVLFPGLRLGYVVAPSRLIQAFAAARTAIDLHPPALTQAILAEFMEGGHYWRHVRRMRTRYAARCEELVEALTDEVGSSLRLGPHDSGMHFILWLPKGVNDREVSRRAAELEVECLPLSGFIQGSHRRSGLVLGFGRLAIEHIRPAVRRLAQAVFDQEGGS